MKEVYECAYDELVSLDELKPNPLNINKHPKEQIKRLAKIIKEQGQRAPIVVSTRSGYITKGHGRLEALKLLGWQKAAVDYQDYKSEAYEYADMTADNKIATWAEFADDKLAEVLPTLGDMDLELLGLQEITHVDIDIPTMDSQEESIKELPDEKPYRIVYELCFNDEIEQEHWYSFLQALKRKFPEVETISERVIAVTDDWVSKNG